MVLAATLAGVGIGNAHAELRYNMPEGVSEISRNVHSLHMTMFWICVAIGALVFGAMFYSIVRFRKSSGAQPAHFHENTAVELIWTAIPFAILVAMTIPAAGVLIKMDDTSQADLTIKITGYQWKWHYDYLDQDVSFFSALAQDSNAARQLGAQIDLKSVDHYLLNVDHPVVVPIGQKVRFLITSNDVNHAWWVPDLAVKKDAIPGFINEFWTRIDVPGVYRGQCAELCGRDHAFMPIVVEAKTPEDYAVWLEAQRTGKGTQTAMMNEPALAAAR
ncbi:MAG TPA: cytochrome c oxidase subunit II [Candidatus Macondimonas sp.]|nr:cytochrome c oxidase subunit II [Candidatus Macondimonas sp.]